MNKHITEQHAAHSVIYALSDHKELEIEREMLLQRNGLAALESTVSELMARLEQVMHPSEPASIGGEPGKFPQTQLGESMRSATDRINGLNAALSNVLQRLELS
ncbi:hypothetical protein [Paenalcaligenes suwonensis]|uniref:hypothetical protein n=1 Tax=Paenalcaligenes suwonensis TaxID=1202713 RepID=UPI001409E502|nr:hypothetical protein [Paenalcaligenes suwonensis]NHC63066.1 hypothetical protein [Paenalcaligenes suwonensis]